MLWVAVVLTATSLAALVNIFDKTVIHRYARTPYLQPLVIGIAMMVVGIPLFAVTGIPPSAPLDAILWALISGLFIGLGTHILVYVLYTQEVSRAIPVYQTYPIFTALMAFFFLGERPDVAEWLAVLAMVVGAVLLSSGTGIRGRGFLLNRPFLLLVLGSAMEGSSFVFGKSAVNELPVLFAHALRLLALSSTLIALNLRWYSLQQVLWIMRTRSPALRYIALNQLVVSNASQLLLLWALSLGPAVFVTALSSLRTSFVVVFAIFSSLIWRGTLGEVTTPRTVTVKLTSTALIVGGVVVIALGST